MNKIILLIFFSFTVFAEEDVVSSVNMYSWFSEGKWYYAMIPSGKKEINVEDLEKNKKENIAQIVSEIKKLPEGVDVNWNTHKISSLQQSNPPASETKQVFGAVRSRSGKIKR